jgi:hypothetical protein
MSDAGLRPYWFKTTIMHPDGSGTTVGLKIGDDLEGRHTDAIEEAYALMRHAGTDVTILLGQRKIALVTAEGRLLWFSNTPGPYA